MLQFTIPSRQHLDSILHTAVQLRQIDNATIILWMFSRFEVHKAIHSLWIIKLPKKHRSDDQWYAVVHMRALLCVGLMRYAALTNVTQSAKHLQWYYDTKDDERRTLVAQWGNVKTTYRCQLQFEEVIHDSSV